MEEDMLEVLRQLAIDFDTLEPEKEAKRPSIPWNQREDQLLTSLIERETCKPHWNEIAEKMAQKSGFERRSGSEVRQRWTRVLCPLFNKGKWSKEEDRLLIKLVEEHDHNWATLSKLMVTRSDIQIKYRAMKLGI